MDREKIDAWKAHNPPAKLAEQMADVERRGSVRMMRCPFHEDKTPSMAVYDDGFHCFGCGWHGDAVAFIMAINDWSFQQFVDFIAGFEVDLRQPPHAVDRPAREKPAIESARVEWWAMAMGEREFAYWRKQRITAGSLGKFGVGWTGQDESLEWKYRQRYSIPWRYRNVVMGVKMRRDDDVAPDKKPKYISLEGGHFDVPYNIDAAILPPYPVGPLLICEDEKSVWAAAQYDLTAISYPAGTFRSEWARLLWHIDNIIIVADWDDPGLAAAEERQDILRRARIVQAGGFFPDGREATDLHDMHMALRGQGDQWIKGWLGIT